MMMLMVMLMLMMMLMLVMMMFMLRRAAFVMMMMFHTHCFYCRCKVITNLPFPHHEWAMNLHFLQPSCRKIGEYNILKSFSYKSSKLLLINI